MRTFKRRLLIGGCIFAGLLIAGWIVGRITGAVQWYRIISESSLPTLRVGERRFFTNLKKPKRFSTITYRHNDAQFGEQIWLHRLIGVPGDELSIIDGIVSVNSVPVDGSLNLLNEYAVAHSFAISDEAQEASEASGGENPHRPFGDDSESFLWPDKVVAEKHLPARRVLRKPGMDPEGEGMMMKTWHNAWSVDQFGPVHVPPGYYFVLGDNRHNAMDSRFIGFIPIEDVVGTLL